MGEVKMRTAASIALTTVLMVPAAAKDAIQAPDAETTVTQRHGGEPGKSYHGVRHQQGRVLTDSDQNSADSGGILSRDEAIEQRHALAPLKKRVRTVGLRTMEVEYAEKLHHWAVRQDKRLLELQKIHTAYDRLKAYRDSAAAEREDVSRIDTRLEGMERKMAALSREIRAANAELQELTARYEAELKMMSQIIRTQHDAAKAVIEKAG